MTPSVVLFVVVCTVLVLMAAVLHKASEIARSYSVPERLRRLGAAAQTYKMQHDGSLPQPGADQSPTWADLSESRNAQAWYNELPHLLGNPSAAELSKDPDRFYKAENTFYLPSADYPANKKLKPMFAIALNRKALEEPRRSYPSASSLPAVWHTVLFFETGLMGEKKMIAIQSKYDGSPDSTLRTFVERSSGMGVVAYTDGSVGYLASRDIYAK